MMGVQSRKILVVDDEKATLKSMQLTLRGAGFENVATCSESREVLELIRDSPPALLLLDLMMPPPGGEEILAQVGKSHPELPVVVFTAEYNPETAVRCMKAGAADYLLKPVDRTQLVTVVQQVMDRSALEFEASHLREVFLEKHITPPDAFSGIITSDQTMLRLFVYLEAISRGSHSVLITGETGTGKELVARALHRASGRGGSFEAVNVAGLDDEMFSDTLFGHLPGAFTGAASVRRGMIEVTGEGTLLLDEIGDLSEASQVKLLRMIQEREYRPLGSDSSEPIRARIVAATHQDVSKFREDLYYRLRTYAVHIPPLRDRLGDLPLLVDHFLEAAAKDLGRNKPRVPPELFSYLSNYHFPGNVREIEAIVFDAVAHCTTPILSLDSFVKHMKSKKQKSEPERRSEEVIFPFPLPTLKEIESAAIIEALDRLEGNQSAVARMLDISRPTVSRYLNRMTKRPKE